MPDESMLNRELPALDDPEGESVPYGLPPVIDAHVHVFPEKIFQSVWAWFDRHAWKIRYRFESAELLDFLLSRGVRHVVAFQYAHKPGMARELNRYMADLCRRFPGKVTGLATVFPGEEDAEGIMKEAFGLGLQGVKLHAHVQCFDMNAEEMAPIYSRCIAEGKPMVMHVGREPKSPAYACDPYAICRADKVERVLREFPGLRICVPHLGIDEFRPYRRLIEAYDNLWLDTAMALADYFPIEMPFPFDEWRADRILYGSDFSNIPYAWDRELKIIRRMKLPGDVLEAVLGGNAAEFFNIDNRKGEDA